MSRVLRIVTYVKGLCDPQGLGVVAQGLTGNRDGYGSRFKCQGKYSKRRPVSCVQ